MTSINTKVFNCLSLLVIRRFTCAEKPYRNHCAIKKKKKKKNKPNTQNSCEEKQNKTKKPRAKVILLQPRLQTNG